MHEINSRVAAKLKRASTQFKKPTKNNKGNAKSFRSAGEPHFKGLDGKMSQKKGQPNPFDLESDFLTSV